MSEDKYDARDTAKMVVTSLKVTLGLSRTQLASKLVHFRLESISLIYFENPMNEKSQFIF